MFETTSSGPRNGGKAVRRAPRTRSRLRCRAPARFSNAQEIASIRLWPGPRGRTQGEGRRPDPLRSKWRGGATHRRRFFAVSWQFSKGWQANTDWHHATAFPRRWHATVTQKQLITQWLSVPVLRLSDAGAVVAAGRRRRVKTKGRPDVRSENWPALQSQPEWPSRAVLPASGG